jgi:hypothetical protein
VTGCGVTAQLAINMQELSRSAGAAKSRRGEGAASLMSFSSQLTIGIASPQVVALLPVAAASAALSGTRSLRRPA